MEPKLDKVILVNAETWQQTAIAMLAKSWKRDYLHMIGTDEYASFHTHAIL